MRHPRASSRRAFVIVAVLICVVVGSLVAASMLSSTRIVAQRVRLLEDSTDARLAVAAAQHACQQLLLEQRDRLLMGEPAELPERIVLFEHNNQRAIARLVPVRDQFVRPTAARIDVNAAPDTQLRALESLNIAPAAIDAILSARRSRPILSLDDLIDNNAITPDLVHGDLNELIETLSPNAPAASLPGQAAAEPFAAQSDHVLADLLTVYAADPNVQLGLDPDRASAFGRNRINLNREFSEEMAEAIRTEFDDDVVNVVRGLIVGQNIRFTDDSIIIKTLTQFGVDPKDWASILDSFSTSPDPYLRSRIDLNQASPHVIATLPGLPADASERIVNTRDSLSAEERRSPTWVAAQSQLAPAEYAVIAPLVTSRSLQFEILIETGYEPIESSASAGSTMSQPLANWGEADQEPLLRARRLTELTIDLAAPRPRLAAIRDVTHLPIAAGLWLAVREAADATPTIERIAMDDWQPDDPIDSPELATFGIPDSFFDPAADPSLSVSEAPPGSGDGADAPASGSAGSPQAVDRRTGRWKASSPSSGSGSQGVPTQDFGQ